MHIWAHIYFGFLSTFYIMQKQFTVQVRSMYWYRRLKGAGLKFQKWEYIFNLNIYSTTLPHQVSIETFMQEASPKKITSLA